MSKREGYYDYMLRRTKEENMKFDGTYKEPDFTDNLGERISTSGSILRREIKVINEQYYGALIRIKELNEEIMIWLLKTNAKVPRANPDYANK